MYEYILVALSSMLWRMLCQCILRYILDIFNDGPRKSYVCWEAIKCNSALELLPERNLLHLAIGLTWHVLKPRSRSFSRIPIAQFAPSKQTVCVSNNCVASCSNGGVPRTMQHDSMRKSCRYGTALQIALILKWIRYFCLALQFALLHPAS